MRQRDRHGRGLRGPLAPPDSPLSASRAARFDGFVFDAVERIEQRWAEASTVDVDVAEVPPASLLPDLSTLTGEVDIPLGTHSPSSKGTKARITIFRRPIELRCETPHEAAVLVADVVAEQMGHLLGMPPSDIDPGYRS